MLGFKQGSIDSYFFLSDYANASSWWHFEKLLEDIFFHLPFVYTCILIFQEYKISLISLIVEKCEQIFKTKPEY